MPDAFISDQYGPVIAKLLREDRSFDLGPGKPAESLRGMLRAVTPSDLFQSNPIQNDYMANACLSGLWLYFDFLNESHSISQNIPSTTGSLWHGIMHRREPDYPNAKYWFQKVPTHPIYAPLQRFAAGLAAKAPDAPAFLLNAPDAWNPFSFVDLCQEHCGANTPIEDLCCKIQRREWEMLFHYSYVHAIGKN